MTLPILLAPLGAESTLVLPDHAGITLVSATTAWGGSGLSNAVPLGDWDGDGHGDLAAGNSGFGSPEQAEDCLVRKSCQGAVFFLAGPLQPGTLDVETESDWVSNSWTPGNFGEQLAAGSDLDGDGFPDLAVADYASYRTHVFFGGGDI